MLVWLPRLKSIQSTMFSKASFTEIILSSYQIQYTQPSIELKSRPMMSILLSLKLMLSFLSLIQLMSRPRLAHKQAYNSRLRLDISSLLLLMALLCKLRRHTMLRLRPFLSSLCTATSRCHKLHQLACLQFTRPLNLHGRCNNSQ